MTSLPQSDKKTITMEGGAASLDDDRFKSFLQNADEIESVEHFAYWKDEFLRTFRQYLDPLGTATAREADENLYFELEQLAKACLTTKNLVKEGKISPDRSSVAGQRSLNEMTELMKSCEDSIDAYFPKTKAMERRIGYSKFELAAVLVRDGFRVYGLMCATRDYVANLVTEGGALAEVLKPNQLSIVMYYFRGLESFTETMADLGMYKLMEQCVEIYRVRPRAKKKRSKKYQKDSGKDALSDTSDDDVINKGRMFENRSSGKKTRAIIDNGWSNGFAMGEEVKGPGKKPKSKKDRKGSTSSKSKKPSSKRDKNSADASGSGSKKGSGSKRGLGKDGGDENKDGDPAASDESKNGTDTTEHDAGDSDDGSDDSSDPSSEEEKEDDPNDFIYYFDPVQKVVGKLGRAACLGDNLILSQNNSGMEGRVDDWEGKPEDNLPGKAELILQLKEILRGDARTKVGGLD